MKVGISLDARNPPLWRQPWSDFYASLLEGCEQADRLGFDSVWLTEHHFFEDGYLPQTLTLATLSFDFPASHPRAAERTEYFRGELEQFLAFHQAEHSDPLAPRGSYAGAWGMPQFMPSSLARWGRDYDASEWFVVPRAVIDQAIELIQSGGIVRYVYDATEQRLVERGQ